MGNAVSFITTAAIALSTYGSFVDAFVAPMTGEGAVYLLDFGGAKPACELLNDFDKVHPFLDALCLRKDSNELLVLNWRSLFWLRPSEEPLVIPVRNIAYFSMDGGTVSLSPTGNSLFFTAIFPEELGPFGVVLDLPDGPPKKLIHDKYASLSTITWSSDGKDIIYWTRGGLFAVSAITGEQRSLWNVENAQAGRGCSGIYREGEDLTLFLYDLDARDGVEIVNLIAGEPRSLAKTIGKPLPQQADNERWWFFAESGILYAINKNTGKAEEFSGPSSPPPSEQLREIIIDCCESPSDDPVFSWSEDKPSPIGRVGSMGNLFLYVLRSSARGAGYVGTYDLDASNWRCVLRVGCGDVGGLVGPVIVND